MSEFKSEETKCSTCFFVKKQRMPGDYKPPRDDYICCRFPPVTVEIPKGVIPWAVWPRVLEDDWCGEWK